MPAKKAGDFRPLMLNVRRHHFVLVPHHATKAPPRKASCKGCFACAVALRRRRVSTPRVCALDAASLRPLSRSDSAPDALKKPSLLCGCRFAQLDRLPWDSDRVGAVVAFIESDERCDAELRALARVADAVAGLDVEVVAVRSPRGASPASSGEFGKVRFVDDPNSLAKRSLDLPASPVCSFVLGTGGRVQSICSDASDPLAHALARSAILGS